MRRIGTIIIFVGSRFPLEYSRFALKSAADDISDDGPKGLVGVPVSLQLVARRYEDEKVCYPRYSYDKIHCLPDYKQLGH